VTGAILGTLGASLTALLVTRMYVRPPLWGRGAVAIPGLWRYAVPLFLGATATQLFSRLDLFMVKAMVGAPGEAGFYAAAQNMAIAPGLLAAAFSPLLLSALSGLVRDGKDGEVRSLIDHAFRLMLVVLPFVGITAAAAPDLAALVYGGPFVLAGPAAGVLFFAATALFIASVTAAIITALGRPTLALALSAPLVPLALAAHLVVIPRFGLVGAAAVTAVFAWIAAASGVLAVARLARVRLPLSGWLRIIAITIAASVLSHAWRTPTAWLVVELPVMAAGVLASLWAWGAITAADIAVARSLISRPRSAGIPGEANY
jgi:O-antigen/teichoic acid export membrane protein